MRTQHLRLIALLCGPLVVVAIGVGPAGQTRPTDRPVHASYAEHPPLGHTGGFGEPTCHACHFGGEENGGQGTLSIEGLPSTVRPARAYRVTVRLSAAMKRAGFMLSVRGHDGTQAGSLVPVDTSRTAVRTVDSTGVQYAHHTLQGTELTDPNGVAWRVQWTAPPPSVDSTVFHVAANAANDDASEFGDDVYATAVRTRVMAGE